MPTGAPEAAFLVASAKGVGLTAALSLPLAGVLAGGQGLAGAAAAVGLLAVLFGVSAALHHAVAPMGRQLWMLATLGGLGVRLVLYFAALRALAESGAVHGLSLGLTAAAGILIGQVFEMRALVRARTIAVVNPAAAKVEGADR